MYVHYVENIFVQIADTDTDGKNILAFYPKF